jgi:hypothetical protein
MIPTTTKWKRSSFCASGACVEVAVLGADMVALRDGKNPDQPPLLFSLAEWHSFIADVPRISLGNS